MAKSFLKLDMRRALRDGSYPIVIGVGYGRNLYLPTGESARADEWVQGSELPCTGRNARGTNAVIKTKLATVMARVSELRAEGVFDSMDNAALRAALSDAPDTVPIRRRRGRSLKDLFGLVMGVKSGRTAEIYASTLRRLELYADVGAVSFDEVNRMWLDGFVASMSDLSANTRSIHLRNLRAVNNYAIDCEITANYPFRRYKMPVQTSRKRAFGVEVLRNLAALPLGHNGVYRDLFMLTFFLIGINFVDLCSLEGIDADGRVRYRRAKTHKAYAIRVEPEAMAIIERLRGEGQLLYMLDGHKDYRSYYRQLRRGLEAVKKAYNEKYPDAPIAELTTYWARHSWATVAAGLDIPKETIAAALGHDMGNSMTAIYIDFDMGKVDAANRRVIDWVLYGR